VEKPDAISQANNHRCGWASATKKRRLQPSVTRNRQLTGSPRHVTVDQLLITTGLWTAATRIPFVGALLRSLRFELQLLRAFASGRRHNFPYPRWSLPVGTVGSSAGFSGRSGPRRGWHGLASRCAMTTACPASSSHRPRTSPDTCRKNHDSSIENVGEGCRRSPPVVNLHIRGNQGGRLGHGAERWRWTDDDLARSCAAPQGFPRRRCLPLFPLQPLSPAAHFARIYGRDMN
jgi:hypothetical protein